MLARYVARGPFSTKFIVKCREGPLLCLLVQRLKAKGQFDT
jgi:hypothetical protein